VLLLKIGGFIMPNGLFITFNILLILFHFVGVFMVLMANALSASMELGMDWFIMIGFVAASPHLVLMGISLLILKSRDKDVKRHLRIGISYFIFVFLVYVIAQAFFGGF
jgi:hypothetical protein